MLSQIINESYQYFIEAEENAQISPINQGLKQGAFQSIPYGLAGAGLGGIFGAGAGLVGGINAAIYGDDSFFDVPDMIGNGLMLGGAVGGTAAGLYGAKQGFSQGYNLANYANQNTQK